MNNSEIKTILGKRASFPNENNLIAKLYYKSGIDYFDEIQNNKSGNGIIHLAEYEKGIEINLAELFNSNKTAVLFSDIIRLTIIENVKTSLFVIKLQNGNDLVFKLKNENINAVVDYFNGIVSIKVEKEISLPSNDVELKSIEVKHGVPALFSFLIPGLGQMLKNDFIKVLIIWILLGLVYYILGFKLTAIPFAFIIWIWSIYDAYNSNTKKEPE